MPHLVIGDDLSLLLTHDTVLLFLSYQYLFHCFKEILLVHIFSAMLNRIDGCFVDHVGKIRTNRTACGKCDRIKVYTVIQMHIFGMNLKNSHTPLQIRLIYNDSPVKASRTKQRFIQNFRAVGSAKHQNALRSVKTIHLRQELIQSLLSFLVSTAVFAVTASADSIYFIDKDDTGSVLGSFLKQISHTGSAHTHIQFYKIRT